MPLQSGNKPEEPCGHDFDSGSRFAGLHLQDCGPAILLTLRARFLRNKTKRRTIALFVWRRRTKGVRDGKSAFRKRQNVGPTTFGQAPEDKKLSRNLFVFRQKPKRRRDGN